MVLGIIPGRKGKFALCALFHKPDSPPSVVNMTSLTSVEHALQTVVGVVGEWTELSATVIAAPLSWSAACDGWRGCDLSLRKRMPAWVPRAWVRAPNAVLGTVSMQGPALALAMANEIRIGQLPRHRLLETNPRVSLALALPDAQNDIRACFAQAGSLDASAAAAKRICARLIDKRLLAFDVPQPTSPHEIEAIVAALTGLAHVSPDFGLPTAHWAGGDLRPLGKRPLVVLDAIP